MSGRTLRLMGLGMVATAGAGFLSLAAMMNTGYAHADDIGLVLGGSGTPIPGRTTWSPPPCTTFPDLRPADHFYQPTPDDPFSARAFSRPRASTR